MYFVKIEEGNKKEKELSNTITKMPSIIQFICITKISEVNANFSAITYCYTHTRAELSSLNFTALLLGLI